MEVLIVVSIPLEFEWYDDSAWDDSAENLMVKDETNDY